MGEYKYNIKPPVKCSECANNLIELIKSDENLMKLCLNENKYKKDILKNFLSFSKNKTLLINILDPEILKVFKE